MWKKYNFDFFFLLHKDARFRFVSELICVTSTIHSLVITCTAILTLIGVSCRKFQYEVTAPDQAFLWHYEAFTR